MTRIRKFYLGVFLGAALLAFALPSLAAEKSRLLMNWSWPDYYVPHGATIDAIKTSEYPWKRIGGGSVANRDAAGWPAEDFQVTVFGDVPDVAGDYALRFRGAADVRVGGGSLAGPLVTGADGVTRGTVRVTGQTVQLFFRNTSGGVRDLQLLRPGYASADGLWTRSYAEYMRHFGGRSMDWTRTNASTVSEWRDRAKPDDPQWSDPRKGGPWEPFLDFHADRGLDVWVNVPHLYTDDAVRQLARLVAEKMGRAPDAVVYVAHSNEVWNTRFPQAAWLTQAHRAAGLPERMQFHVRRTAEIGRVFREEIGRERVRPVAEFQFGGFAEAQRAVDWHFANGGRGTIWGVAVAGYMGEWLPASTDPAAIAAGLVQAARDWRAGRGNSIQGWKTWRSFAMDRGVELLGYEGGLASAPGGPADVVAARRAAHNRPEVEGAAAEYLDVVFTYERLHCYFNNFSIYNQSGYWGAKNRQGGDTPKSRALVAGAGRFRWNDPYAPPPPVVTEPPPPPVPSTQPTTQPAPTPDPSPALTLEKAIRGQLGEVRVFVDKDAATIRVYNPSPVKDQVYRVRGDAVTREQ